MIVLQLRAVAVRGKDVHPQLTEKHSAGDTRLYDLGMDTLRLKPRERLAHTKYCSNYALVRAVTGRDPQTDGGAWRAFTDAWQIDFIWSARWPHAVVEARQDHRYGPRRVPRGRHRPPLTSLDCVVERYGRTHVIMSSKVDCRTLTFGDKERIRREMDESLEIACDCPGFVFAVGNHIPSNVPVDNALFYFDYLSRNWRR